jgi:hypothetical protein
MAVVALTAKAGNSSGIQGGEEVDSIKLEGTAPGEEVEIANGASGIEGSPGTGGVVGEKPLDPDIVTGRSELDRPLKRQ